MDPGGMMRNGFRSFAARMCWVLALIVAFPCPGPDLDQIEYEQARDVALEIYRAYPPGEYYYVTVGQSLPPVAEVLKHLSPEGTTNLPLSDSYARPEKSPGYYDPLSTEAETNLFKHFNRFLPTKEQLGGRKILLVDYAEGGGSMVGAEEYISKFLDKERKGTKAEVFLLAPSDELPKVTEAGKKYKVQSLQRYPVLAQRLAFSWNKGVSEWEAKTEDGKFKAPYTAELVRRDSGPTTERGKFVARYQQLMTGDQRIKSAGLPLGCPNDYAHVK
jgi:hypothetical protein